MEHKRYYWLRLMSNFFELKTTKYLRSLPDGDKLVNVYLHMQVNSLESNGLLKYDRLFPTIEEELSLSLGEDLNALKLLIPVLEKMNLVSILDDGSIMLLVVQDLVGSETASAQRSREYRAKKSDSKMLQCNNVATTLKQHRTKTQQKSNVEIEKELEKDKYISPVGDTYCPVAPDTPHPKTKNLNEKAKDIIDYLNAKLGTKYKASNRKTLALIKARMSEGFTVEDFKTVIDKKILEWAPEANMCQYLRPVTLFSSKFESYLNQPSQAKNTANKFANFEQRDWDWKKIDEILAND